MANAGRRAAAAGAGAGAAAAGGAAAGAAAGVAAAAGAAGAPPAGNAGNPPAPPVTPPVQPAPPIPPAPPVAPPVQPAPPIPPAPPAVPVAPPLPAWMNNANALGLGPDEMELYELMVNFHSFTHNQYICLMNLGGYSTLQDLNQWRYKAIRKWCENMSAMAVNRGGRTFGDLKVKQLQGIAWWVTDCMLRNKLLDVNEYKLDPDSYKTNAELDYLDSEADTVTVDKPSKFVYKEWIEWEESMYMYFDGITNLHGVPLSYVIRKDLLVGVGIPSLDRNLQVIYNAPLNGYLYNKDNATVGNIIREFCLGTEAESWIKNIKGGRESMTALQDHYDGPDEGKKRLTSARARLDKLFYRNEATFSFEKFVTSLNDIYNIHERYYEPLYESDKIRYSLTNAKIIIRSLSKWWYYVAHSKPLFMEL